MQTTQPITRILWGYCAYSSSRYENGTPIQLWKESLIALCLRVYILCVFAFVRESRSPSPRTYFSFVAQHSKWISNEGGNPNFQITSRQSSSDFRLDDGFWSDATEFTLRSLIMNF
ncbi:hypothetical protein AVEN_31556-1 [Araneus ventricosus]|uniref:Uncharacterized protein n=1 Tax=Araneus ventricosus TaxID=182803 RepID=A0A4Y2KAR7_ARAVE|nr:hypothetical protein AVEN_31556-1 [Araneus ventricosus]